MVPNRFDYFNHGVDGSLTSRLTKVLQISEKFHLVIYFGISFHLGVHFTQPPLRAPVICPATALQLLKRE